MNTIEINRAIDSHKRQIRILKRLASRVSTLENIQRNQALFTNPESIWYGNVNERLKDEQRMELIKGMIGVLTSELHRDYRMIYTSI